MIGYVMVGVKDLAKAAAFYDELFADLGGKRVMEEDRLIVWANEAGMPMFSVCLPYDGQPASVGNGAMVAFSASSKEQVNELHAKALSLGATDEGAPGPRMTLYCGYIRDLDGNKLNLFTM